MAGRRVAPDHALTNASNHTTVGSRFASHTVSQATAAHHSFGDTPDDVSGNNAAAGVEARQRNPNSVLNQTAQPPWPLPTQLSAEPEAQRSSGSVQGFDERSATHHAHPSRRRLLMDDLKTQLEQGLKKPIVAGPDWIGSCEEATKQAVDKIIASTGKPPDQKTVNMLRERCRKSTGVTPTEPSGDARPEDGGIQSGVLAGSDMEDPGPAVKASVKSTYTQNIKPFSDNLPPALTRNISVALEVRDCTIAANEHIGQCCAIFVHHLAAFAFAPFLTRSTFTIGSHSACETVSTLVHGWAGPTASHSCDLKRWCNSAPILSSCALSSCALIPPHAGLNRSLTHALTHVLGNTLGVSLSHTVGAPRCQPRSTRASLANEHANVCLPCACCRYPLCWRGCCQSIYLRRSTLPSRTR